MRKTSYLTATDQFCGAGGTSLGAVQAGIEVTLALNHWKLAVETHNSNFPNTLHDCTDISACDPRRYPSTTILLTSPECTNHSLAKGRKRKNLAQLALPGLGTPVRLDPSEERSRATMFDVPRFAEYHRYEFIIVENVVDARHWVLFDEWLKMMEKLEYRHEIVYFNSMFMPPTPQSRDRMYVVFWRKGNPAPNLRFTPPAYCARCDRQVEAVQSWKKPTRPWGRYGKHRQYVYRCPSCATEVVPFHCVAASAINWDLPLLRIGDRKKPLKSKTIRRIELGLQKFQDAFLIQVNNPTDRVRPPSEALPTQTGENGLAMLSPFLIRTSHGGDSGRIASVLAGPMQTQTTRQDQALVVPSIVEWYGTGSARSLSEPLTTITASGNHHGLVLSPRGQPSFLVNYYGNGNLRPVSEPVGTITTVDRHALVMPPELPGRVEDCSFRMLHPDEVGRAMAFPESYVVLGTGRQKVKQYGNAVTPPVMKMLLERCVATLQ